LTVVAPVLKSSIGPTNHAVLFSSFVGSVDGGSGVGELINALAVDSGANVYLAGASFQIEGVPDLLPVFNALQPVFADVGTCHLQCSTSTAFIIKISPAAGAAAAVVPGQIQFPAQLVGTTSAPQALTMYDLGTDSLTVFNGTVTGDFGIQANSCGTVAASGASCTIRVTFTPTAIGTRNGILTITDSSAGSPHTVGLTGEGGVPAASLSPTNLSFSTQLVGTMSSPQSIVLTNTGGIALQIARIQAAGDFVETNDCSAQTNSVLLPNSSCTIQVTFTPSATGLRTGSVTFADNASDSPQTVAVSGAGANPSLGLGVAPGNSSSATIPAGQTASYTLSIGGAGMSGTISPTCTGAPTGANCSVAAGVQFSATNPVNFNVSVTITSRTIGALHSPGFPLWAMALFGLIILRGAGVAQGRAGRYLFLMFFVLLLCSCGGNSSPGQNPNGTPAGSCKLTVTATSAGTTESTVLTLIVQ
jgi:hypothetical protein